MGSVLVVVVVALAMSVSFILAKEYVVGEGTCFQATWYYGCDYNAWAMKHKFAVDDTLVFYFKVDQSTVAELTKVDYDGCTMMSSSGLNPIVVYNKSPQPVTLSRKDAFYFASVVSGRCFQKFTLDVNRTTTAEDDDALSSSASDTSASHESSSKHSSMVKAVVGSVVGFVLFGAKLSLIVYCANRRKQRQKLNARPQNETSPVLHVNPNVETHVES